MVRLAISNIAWTNEEEPEVANRLQKLGVKFVEIAPTKIWSDPTQTTPQHVQTYLEFWKGFGIEVVAFQSMLFGRPDMHIFGDDQNRADTRAFLEDFIALAGNVGARVLVFGSPKNRQKGEMPKAAADTIAQDFFNRLGDVATQHGTCFCIEPNPTDYACDYVTSAQEGIDLVKAVNNPGFGLHLDIAGMTLAGDNIARSIESAAPLLRHFHASSPHLAPVEAEAGIKHKEAAAALGRIDYQGLVSIEMRPDEAGNNVMRVDKAVRYAQSVYGPYLM